MKESDVRLAPIRNGTAIDHLKPFTAFKVLKILGASFEQATTIAVNTESTKIGRKDLIFLDKTILEQTDIKKIAVVAANATLNEIRESVVARKQKIELPEVSEAVLKCRNANCITNAEEIVTRFFLSDSPLKAKCFYCEKTMSEKEIMDSIG